MSLLDRETFITAARRHADEAWVLGTVFASPIPRPSSIPADRIEKVSKLLEQASIPMDVMRCSWAEYWVSARREILDVAHVLLAVVDHLNRDQAAERWQCAVLPVDRNTDIDRAFHGFSWMAGKAAQYDSETAVFIVDPESDKAAVPFPWPEGGRRTTS